MPKTSSLIFVSMPYSDPSEDVVKERMEIFAREMARFVLWGEEVIGVLWFHHALPLEPRLGSDWDAWRVYSEALIEKCGKLRVIKAPGWEKSSGVAGEIKFAEEKGIPVEYREVGEQPGIIPHHYRNALEQPGQFDAELCKRQAVTAQFLHQHPDMQGYIFDPDAMRDSAWTMIGGVDALVDGSKIVLEYGRTGERQVDPTYQVFVGHADLIKAGYSIPPKGDDWYVGKYRIAG